MADLTKRNAGQVVMLIGADSDGIETEFAEIINSGGIRKLQVNATLSNAEVTIESRVQHFPTDALFDQGDIEPPSLTRFGATWVAIADSEFGAPVLVGPNGVQNSESVQRLIGDNYITGEPLLPHIWTEDFVGSGSSSTISGELVLSTGTTANSKATLETFRRAPFVTGTYNFSHLAISMPDALATDVIREFGVFDPVSGPLNGVTLRNDSGVLSARRYKNGAIDLDVPLGSFTGPNVPVLNDNISIWELWYNAGSAFITQNRKLLHKMVSPLSAAFGTPHLKAGMFVQTINGSTSDHKITTRGLSVSRMGSGNAIPRFFNITASGTFVIKNTPGSLVRIIINDQGTGAKTLTLYNNSTDSGEIIGTIDTDKINGPIPMGFEFDIGLTIKAAGGSVDITVVFV